MDQDELLEGLRGILYKKANKKGWEVCRQLFAEWPDDELPEVVVDYLRAVVYEGLWSKYFPSRGYKTIEELARAPKVEREINDAWSDILQQLEQALKSARAVVVEEYQPSTQDAGIKSVSLEEKTLGSLWNMRMRSKVRNALLRPKNSYNIAGVLPHQESDLIRVELHNGKIHKSGLCDVSFSFHQKNNILQGEAYIDNDHISAWVGDGFQNDWFHHYYDEYYEDDYE